jgi:predicted nucleic acid-binding protein
MDSNSHKKSIAQNILIAKPFINAQVLTEVANVCKRRFSYSKDDILDLWTDLLEDCNFIQTTKATFSQAIKLTKKYNFQVFDAIIISSALDTHCEIFYSEDMQHKMVVEDRLTIINPFV